MYGLCAYFLTRNYARLLRVAEKLDYGIVGAHAGIISTPNAPFGGVKESGYGPAKAAPSALTNTSTQNTSSSWG